jgi:putative effector of murein hydrolase LrgA (UPF0299 family)
MSLYLELPCSQSEISLFIVLACLVNDQHAMSMQPIPNLFSALHKHMTKLFVPPFSLCITLDMHSATRLQSQSIDTLHK